MLRPARPKKDVVRKINLSAFRPDQRLAPHSCCVRRKSGRTTSVGCSPFRNPRIAGHHSVGAPRFSIFLISIRALYPISLRPTCAGSLKFELNFRQNTIKYNFNFILVLFSFSVVLIRFNLGFYFAILREIKISLSLSPQHGETTNDNKKNSGYWTLGHRNVRRSRASGHGTAGKYAGCRKGKSADRPL